MADAKLPNAEQTDLISKRGAPAALREAAALGIHQEASSRVDGPRGTLGMVFKQINPIAAIWEFLPPTFITFALSGGGSFNSLSNKDLRILRFGYFDYPNIADCTKAPHAANDDEVSLREAV